MECSGVECTSGVCWSGVECSVVEWSGVTLQGRVQKRFHDFSRFGKNLLEPVEGPGGRVSGRWRDIAQPLHLTTS